MRPKTSMKHNRDSATPDDTLKLEDGASLATIPVSNKQKAESDSTPKPAQEEKASEEDNTPFRFMDLSGGKLRNLIYELATLDEPHGRVIRLKEANINFGAPDLQRQYLGLTQVSQAVRNEFLPLYTQTYKHEIHFADIPAYLALYPLEDANMMQTMIDLVVGLRHNTLEPPGFEVKSLITLDWSELPFQVFFARSNLADGLLPSDTRLVSISNLFYQFCHDRMAKGPLWIISNGLYACNQGVSILLRMMESCRIEKMDSRPNQYLVTFVLSSTIPNSLTWYFAIREFFDQILLNAPAKIEFELRPEQH
ncbi:hypothetical protein TUN205_06173 [Pyrenophora tritici-repentis]|nr:hypothetical protein TUN205_06173 [Pyrenophora tritici-repentis]